jgi:hypothetical protein
MTSTGNPHDAQDSFTLGVNDNRIMPPWQFVNSFIHPKGELLKCSTVIFEVTDKGIFFMPCEIKEKDAYSQEEWGKIERLDIERSFYTSLPP